jgi:hypothetical protein
MGHRLPHLQVVERFLGVVGRQDDLAFGRADDDGEARILLQTVDQLRRLEAWERIDIAGQQRVHLRRRILHDLEDHRVELDRAGIAIGRRLHQRDRIALLALLEHERAGADRLLVVGRRRLGMHDAGIAQRQAVEQEGVGRLQRHLHRRGIGDLDLVDVGEQRLGRIGRIGCNDSVEAELHDRGIECLAIVVLHALPQLEDILLAVLGDVPAFGQTRTDGAGAVDAAQALEDRGRRDLTDRGRCILRRVEQRRFERHANHQPVLGLSHSRTAKSGCCRQRTGGAEKMTAGKCVHVRLLQRGAVYQRPNTSRQPCAMPSVAA